MQYIAKIESRVAGIPCLIGVIEYKKYKGSYSYNAPSDLDYYGYTDIEYHILDRKGYKADWLASKVLDDSDIIETINNFYGD